MRIPAHLALFPLVGLFITTAFADEASLEALPTHVVKTIMTQKPEASPAAMPTTLPACVSPDGKEAKPNPVDKNGHITHFKAPAIRLMRTQSKEPRGTVLIFPSGGYHVLSVISDGVEKANFWNGLGYDAAILEYTISEKGWDRNDAVRDAALKDALASVTLLRTHAKELGLHDGKFILMGSSAGGHLAARTVAALPEKDRPDVLVLFYPAYLEEAPAGSQAPGMTIPAGKLPRLFAAMAANDNSQWIGGLRTYVAAWKKAGGEADFQFLRDGGHGFASGSEAAKEWPQRLKLFIEGF